MQEVAQHGRDQRLARFGHPGEHPAQHGQRHHLGDPNGMSKAKDQAREYNCGPDADLELGGIVEDAPKQQLLGQRSGDGRQAYQHDLNPDRRGSRKQGNRRVGRCGCVDGFCGKRRRHQQRQGNGITPHPEQQVFAKAVQVPAELFPDGCPPPPCDDYEQGNWNRRPNQIGDELQNDHRRRMSARRQTRQAMPPGREKAGECSLLRPHFWVNSVNEIDTSQFDEIKKVNLTVQKNSRRNLMNGIININHFRLFIFCLKEFMLQQTNKQTYKICQSINDLEVIFTHISSIKQTSKDEWNNKSNQISVSSVFYNAIVTTIMTQNNPIIE